MWILSAGKQSWYPAVEHKHLGDGKSMSLKLETTQDHLADSKLSPHHFATALVSDQVSQA